VSRARHEHAATHVPAVRVGDPAVVAWLRPAAAAGASAAGSAADEFPPLPLDAEQCLALATLVLDSTRPRGAAAGPEQVVEHGTFPGIGEAAAQITGLAGWLGTPSPATDDLLLLERLAASLVCVDPVIAAGPPHAADALAAARVLRRAVTAAIDLLRSRKDFQAAVAEARLEAMRELAYGAGHEINNPLANIATRAQALLLEEADPERRRRLSTIVDQSFRARDMIGGLMLFARPPKPRPAAADVGGLLAAVIESVRSQAAARGVRLEYSPSPTPCSAFVDRVQVEEAIRVVVLNAIEAVEPGGRVLLGAGATTLGGRDWSWITISDEGRGMSAEEARRAFDPFFSGREAGRGAGLGLPKAWRLIDASGGRVLLESRLGQGTRATITLPATASTPVAEAALGAARA